MGCFVFVRLGRFGAVVLDQHVVYWLESFCKGPGVPITGSGEDAFQPVEVVATIARFAGGCVDFCVWAVVFVL